MELSDFKNQFSVWRGQYGRFLPKDKHAKILDVGCGNGGIVYWLQSKGYENTEGIDINREDIARALGLGIKNLHHGDAASFLRGKSNEYEAILFVDTLGFLAKEEVTDALHLAVSALKSDGILIIRSANVESPLGGRIRHGRAKEETPFTEHGLKEMVERSGAKTVGAYPVRPVVHGLKSLVRFCLWLVIEVLLKFYRLVEVGSARGIVTQNMIVVGKK